MPLWRVELPEKGFDRDMAAFRVGHWAGCRTLRPCSVVLALFAGKVASSLAAGSLAASVGDMAFRRSGPLPLATSSSKFELILTLLSLLDGRKFNDFGRALDRSIRFAATAAPTS